MGKGRGDTSSVAARPYWFNKSQQHTLDPKLEERRKEISCFKI